METIVHQWEVAEIVEDFNEITLTAKPLSGDSESRDLPSNCWGLIRSDDRRGGTVVATLSDCIDRAEAYASEGSVTINPDVRKAALEEMEDLKRSYLAAITGCKSGVIRNPETKDVMIMQWGWLEGIPFITSIPSVKEGWVGRKDDLQYELVKLDVDACSLINKHSSIKLFQTYRVWTCFQEAVVTVLKEHGDE